MVYNTSTILVVNLGIKIRVDNKVDIWYSKRLAKSEYQKQSQATDPVPKVR